MTRKKRKNTKKNKSKKGKRKNKKKSNGVFNYRSSNSQLDSNLSAALGTGAPHDTRSRKCGGDARAVVAMENGRMLLYFRRLSAFPSCQVAADHLHAVHRLLLRLRLRLNRPRRTVGQTKSPLKKSDCWYLKVWIEVWTPLSRDSLTALRTSQEK